MVWVVLAFGNGAKQTPPVTEAWDRWLGGSAICGTGLHGSQLQTLVCHQTRSCPAPPLFSYLGQVRWGGAFLPDVDCALWPGGVARPFCAWGQALGVPLLPSLPSAQPLTFLYVESLPQTGSY